MSDPHPHRNSEATPSSGATDDPFGLCASTIGDKYRIDSVVGAGGFGVVYRGVHAGFDEPIAIKCLKLPAELGEPERERLVARLRDEGRVLHRLSKLTSGIVQALDVGAITTPTGAWVPYLVLEWLDGETLAQHTAKRARQGAGPMPLGEALDLLEPAAQALAVAHQQKVAHRDVKPENLFVTRSGAERTIKLLDFGIAKVLTQHATFTATQQQATAFTPSYGAPEQFNKKRGATGPWTDVFALALILVELVSGERALDGDDATQLYISAADPASRPTLRFRGVDTSEPVEEVLQRALAVEPADRYEDAGAFWAALRRAAGHVETSTPPPADVSTTGEFICRHEIDLAGPVSARREDETVPEPSAAREAEDAPRPGPSSGARSERRGEDAAAPREPRPEPATMGDEASTTRPSATERQSAPDERDPVGARSSPWVPVVVVLALGGAGALYWQLRSIGPAPVEGQSSGAAAGPAASGSPARSRNAGRASTHPSASQQPSGQQAAAPADGGPPDAAGVTIGDAGSDAAGDGSDGGSGDAGAAAASPPGPPEGMVYIAPPPGREAGAGPGHFFIDRAEVSTAAYRECVMAGRCPKATRVVLTDEAARALVGGLAPDATAPEQLASAWGRRCNAVREALDHPVNCVSSASAEDYCAWRRKRLPTSAEWTLAAAGAVGRRYPWGEQAPECDFACYGLNGTCVARAKEVASCAGGSHDRDATGDGVTDLAGNLAEWVSDQSPEQSAGGPPWRVLRGGSFLDEAAGLVTTTARAAPPVTAYVSIGFRCAKDVPAAGTGVR